MLDMVGEAALRTALLAGVVQCSLWLLRIRRPRLLLAAWTIVLAASLTMPLLLRVTPLRLPLDPALSSTLMDGAADLLQHPSPKAPPALPAFAGGVTEVGTRASLTAWLEVLYLVVCFGIVLRVMLGVALSLRLLARAVPAWPDWAAGMRVRISRDVAGPVTIAHVVLLPSDVADWTAETKKAVLAHEAAHVARQDFALLIVSQLNRAVFWFSPLSWWLHRRLVTLTELASDDQAIACTRDRLGYAEILLEMGRRAGPVPRGPAMARLSTLPRRIDRILVDRESPNGSGRAQQALLTIGTVGLSLMAAGLTPGGVSNPAMTLLARQQDRPEERLIPPVLQEVAAEFPIPPFAPVPGAAPVARPSFASAEPVPMPPVAQPPHPAAVPLPRAAPRTAAKSAPALPPPRTTPASHAAPEPGGRNDGPIPSSLGTEAARLPATGGIDAVSRAGGLAGIEAHLPLPRLFSDGSLPTFPHPDFEAAVGSTCTGTLVVGQRAGQGWTTSRPPDVVAGQNVPVQAQFFRRGNGTSWVRFTAFGRPPLDLPVRFARAGMTWTGEYGISYTVRDAGGRRLTGLAALIANDSATLELGCATSANRLF